MDYQKNMKSSKLQQGFTLLEIIVVVTIIAILAAYIAPKVAGRADDARIAKAKSDIRVLESSLELYKLDNFTYPDTSQGLEALVNPLVITQNGEACGRSSCPYTC